MAATWRDKLKVWVGEMNRAAAMTYRARSIHAEGGHHRRNYAG
jgi:hypothetical protein